MTTGAIRLAVVDIDFKLCAQFQWLFMDHNIIELEEVKCRIGKRLLLFYHTEGLVSIELEQLDFTQSNCVTSAVITLCLTLCDY